ncbi:MAG: hypothetical protein JWO33_808 [Caulobacteraceae bacterium]|nr:hypothetical protein [Caulobacteraceae bacterium]
MSDAAVHQILIPMLWAVAAVVAVIVGASLIAWRDGRKQRR